MKKNIFGALLLSGLVFSATGITADAVEQANGDSVETSEVEVKLTKPKGYDDGSGPFKDKLAIVHKPKAFQFAGETTNGSLNLANKNANKDTQFITVNDDRSLETDDTQWKMGTWTLQGQLSTLVDSSAKVLPAKMNFTTDTMYQYQIGALTTNSDGSEDYEPAGVTEPLTAVTGSNYTLAPTFTLEAGAAAGTTFLSSTTATPFAKTDDTDVRGVTTNLGNANLAIATGGAPIGAAEGNYAGTITWTLSASATAAP